MRFTVIGVLATLLATPALAQSGSAQPAAQPPSAGGVLVRVAQNGWANAKRNIVESADQMPGVVRRLLRCRVYVTDRGYGHRHGRSW